MLVRTLRLSLLASSFLAIGACSAQRDTSYRGEPLAVLHGMAVNPNGGQPPALEAVLVWESIIEERGGEPGVASNAQTSIATRTVVSGQFPSAFTMEALTPPPDEVMVPCGGPPSDSNHETGRFALGYLKAIRQGADERNVQPADIYGDAPDYIVIYADSDINGCDFFDMFLLNRAVFSSGYHLFEYAVGRDAPFAEVPLETTIALGVQGEPLRPIQHTKPVSPEHPTDPMCLDSALPVDATGKATCRLLNEEDGPCTGPGESDVDVATTARYEPYGTATSIKTFHRKTLCQIAEIPTSLLVNGSCESSPQAGFCYVTGAAAGSCGQAIRFSPAGVPSDFGGAVVLVCP